MIYNLQHIINIADDSQHSKIKIRKAWGQKYSFIFLLKLCLSDRIGLSFWYHKTIGVGLPLATHGTDTESPTLNVKLSSAVVLIVGAK